MPLTTPHVAALLVAIAISSCQAGEAPDAPDCAAPGDADATTADGAPVPVYEGFGLPVIAICADPGALTALDARTAEPDALEIEVAVDFDGVHYEDVEMELHGGFARTVAKKSYRLEFEGDGLPFPFDGEADPDEQRHLVLQASWIDPTWLRNDLTFASIRALGGLAPRTGHAVVYLNGVRHGLYQVIERVDRRFLEHHELDEDANLYKAVDHRANWAAKPHPIDGFEHKINEDNPTSDLGPFLDALTSTPADAASFAAGVEPVLHLDDWFTYQLVHSYALNQDAFTKNYYLYHDLDAPPGAPAARFRVISWDADATWGQDWDGGAIPVDSWPGRGLGVGVNEWHGRDSFSPRILGIEAYRERYLERALAALDGPIADAVLDARASARGAAIADAARDDLARWQPERDFDQELARLREAVATRHAALRARIEALEDDDEDPR
ncbi:MAG: hypothetical protein CVU56_10200 [Deltaproteobacteria bacterium HGW-Deltaproteobacteria-14]|jgi:spore coat protein CotH|nr:MAG: hypothetical protein CVU56_10200 [Deltaproteobacteria bacterium HGW-Deltaproteobacteria-14]